ncbi:MAG: hypothetical protein HY758_04660 [Nitrospirae bacterium]|nr:hypothetical protein [Nitrospirota bacterium]
MVTDFFRERGKILLPIALLIVIYTFLTANSPCITPEKIYEFSNLPAKDRTLVKMRPCAVDLTQSGEYGLWDWVGNNLLSGETIAYTYHPTLLAPLWNRGLSNKIVYIEAGAKFNEWIKALETNKVNYMLIKPLTVESWRINRLKELSNDPQWSSVYQRFKLLYSDNNNLIFRFE